MAKKKKTEQQEHHEQIVEEVTEVEAPEAGTVVAEQQEAEVSEQPAAEEPLQQELENVREEAARNHELYLRAMADMENLRKRSQREKEDIAKFSNETLLREILPVIDNLERAVEHAVADNATEGLLEGVQMTLDQFGKVLEKFNVVAVEALGKNFDPALHQAMGQLETEEYPVNVVAQEMQKGYLLNERLLRPALVMVAKAPADEGAETAVESQPDEDK